MYDCRTVVGIEFGTTHSGFGYSNDSYTIVRCITVCRYEIPTVVSYDDEYENVQSWGYPALERNNVELFKLLLGEMENEPPLSHEKAISDYLRELGKIVKEEICRHWESRDFYKEVLIILTIPDNYKVSTSTMRECAFKAGLLNDCDSQNLKLITESEATSLYCMRYMNDGIFGKKFIVVECGDDKINLTTRMILIDEILSVILEKTEDNCGSSFVYQEFLKFLEHKVGSSAIDRFSENHKTQLQYLQSDIKRDLLIPFTGKKSKFILNLKEYCPALIQYCEGEYRNNMIEVNWVIKIEFEDVKAMLDPIMEKIIQLIDSQLNLYNDDCYTLMLVGKFTESKYLQSRIEETFNKRVRFISIPPSPETAIISGAVQYGLNFASKGIENDIQQIFEKFKEEKEKLQDENKLYNNLKGNYNDLTNKYNEEASQHQKIFENLKSEIKEIEEKYSKNIHHLENKIEDINQQYQNKIKLQGQKESQMQNKFQEEIQASNNNFNKYKSLYDNLQEKYDDLTNKYNEETNQHQIIVENLDIEIKGIEDKYLKIIQQLENQNKDIIQQHQNKIKSQEQRESQMQSKLQEEIQILNNNFNDHKLLYNNLQEKYENLTNKYNEETNQHQIIVKNLKNDVKGLENQIEDINQQHQNKIKLQEQEVDQLQKSLKLKEIQLQSLEKEKKELDSENDYLYQKNTDLINQLENTSFEDELSNYKLEDVAQNYVMKINDDISKLNNNLKKYVTNLKQPDTIVNVEEIRKLLLLYKCPVKITNQKDDLLLIQAVLQRHIIETIFSYATKYFQSTGQHYHLESDIINQASSLSTLLTDASKYRAENDEIMRIASTKLRKQIYLILNNCGFSDIHGKSDTAYEHPFITYYKEILNKTMNELRTIKVQEKVKVEDLAATIICEVIKIFWFRLKIYESVAQYVWIPYNAKVDETFMEGENFDDNDNENLYVDLCYFPLIGKDLTSNYRKVYVPAKVFVRKNQQIQKD